MIVCVRAGIGDEVSVRKLSLPRAPNFAHFVGERGTTSFERTYVENMFSLNAYLRAKGHVLSSKIEVCEVIEWI